MARRTKASVADEVQQALRATIVHAVANNYAIASRVGLNPVDVQCLNVLSLTGPQAPRELAATLALSKGGAVTTMIDRLVRGGYVRRTPHPTDRRQVLVELVWSEPTRRLSAEYASEERRMARLQEAFTTHDLEVVRDFLRELASDDPA